MGNTVKFVTMNISWNEYLYQTTKKKTTRKFNITQMNPQWKLYTCLHNILSIPPSNQILRINNLFNARTWVVMLNESSVKILVT